MRTRWEHERVHASKKSGITRALSGVLLEETARALFIARKSLKGTVIESRPVERRVSRQETAGARASSRVAKKKEI
jgi:hypothetical protein